MSDLPHGKDPDHLQVAISDAPATEPRGGLTVTYVASCPISQNPAGEPIIIVGPAKRPTDGLHLRRASWPFMVGQINAHGAMAKVGQTLQIEHRIGESWIVAWTLTVLHASVISDRIHALAVEAGA